MERITCKQTRCILCDDCGTGGDDDDGSGDSDGNDSDDSTE